MRSAKEFCQRQIEVLARALQRPMMHCGSALSADLYFSDILSNLCWFDERESEFATVVRQLLDGSHRVYGQFFFQHLALPDSCINEIASTYAEAGYRLGYYTPARLLTEREFADLKSAIDHDFLKTDHNESELVLRFGEPTHDVLGGQTTVHCYGCCNRTLNWVYFDYARCYPPKDLRSYELFDDPYLRDVRRKDNKLELLPFADWCRNPRADSSEG